MERTDVSTLLAEMDARHAEVLRDLRDDLYATGERTAIDRDPLITRSVVDRPRDWRPLAWWAGAWLAGVLSATAAMGVLR